MYCFSQLEISRRHDETTREYKTHLNDGSPELTTRKNVKRICVIDTMSCANCKSRFFKLRSILSLFFRKLYKYCCIISICGSVWSKVLTSKFPKSLHKNIIFWFWDYTVSSLIIFASFFRVLPLWVTVVFSLVTWSRNKLTSLQLHLLCALNSLCTVFH